MLKPRNVAAEQRHAASAASELFRNRSSDTRSCTRDYDNR